MSNFRTAVHQSLWQRFPYALRRQALFNALSVISPRPTPAAVAVGPIVVAGALSTASGLGQAGRLCYDALYRSGLNVKAIDLTEPLLQPSDHTGFKFEDGRQLMGPATLLLHVNSPLVPMALMYLGRRFVRHKHIVGSWAWELPQLPVEWRIGVPFVHQIMVHSNFVAAGMRSIAGNRPVHVRPLPTFFEADALAGRRPRQNSQPFTVLTVFNAASSIARKNPMAAISAFRAAFGDDNGARMIVKASNLAVVAGGQQQLAEAIGGAHNISVIDSVMERNDLDALFAAADVVLSLHRSEGFGLVVAEAMARGLPVVATSWSGNVDFLSDSTGIPVPFGLVSAEDRQNTYHYPDMLWAEADTAYAADALRRLRADPEMARRLGQRAAEFASDRWAPKAYADALIAQLQISNLEQVPAE